MTYLDRPIVSGKGRILFSVIPYSRYLYCFLFFWEMAKTSIFMYILRIVVRNHIPYTIYHITMYLNTMFYKWIKTHSSYIYCSERQITYIINTIILFI